MRVLLVDNGLIRRWGDSRYSANRSLCNGAIRNNYRLYEFSDRDMVRFLSPVGIRPIGRYLANRALYKVAVNFRPDALIIGHCENIYEDTLMRIHEVLPRIRMGHINVDNPQTEHGRKQILQRMKSCSAFFETTGGAGALREFARPGKTVAWIPNPCDEAIDIYDNGLRTDGFERDVFYAAQMNPQNPRYGLVKAVRERLLTGPVKAEFLGMFGEPPRFGYAYEELIRTSKMGLNINRWDGQFKWSSSDRIAHLMGNGLLTFQSDNNQLQYFFSERELVFFKDAGDLCDKVEYYAAHDDERRAIASAGRAAYHRMFSGKRVLKFMLETLFEEKYSEDYEWTEEIYRG